MPNLKLKNNRYPRQEGFAIVVMMVVIGIVATISVLLLNYVTSSRKAAKHFETSQQALQLAEAGIQKALFCLSATDDGYCGGTVGQNYVGEDNLPILNGRIDITVLHINETERDVAAKATLPDGQTATVIARVFKDFPFDDLTQFPYSITTSNKLKIKNEAQILNGPIYTNSDIDCKKEVVIEQDVYTSLANGTIDQCTIIGNAHAARIKKSEVSEGCYYSQLLDKTVCGSEYPSSSPSPVVSMTEFDLDFWRGEAEKGGVYVGEMKIKEDTTLGPIKIEGKLKIEKKATVTLQGPVWVTDRIEIKKESILKIDESFGKLSMVLLGDGILVDDGVGWGEDWPEEEDIWDEGSGKSGKSGCKSSGASGGRIKIGDKVDFRGTGELGSYIIIVSTSTKNPAIEAKKETSGAIYLAPNSGVKIKDRSTAVAVAAKCAEIGKETIIGYDEFDLPAQLRILTYVEGDPRWRIEAGTWREL